MTRAALLLAILSFCPQPGVTGYHCYAYAVSRVLFHDCTGRTCDPWPCPPGLCRYGVAMGGVANNEGPGYGAYQPMPCTVDEAAHTLTTGGEVPEWQFIVFSVARDDETIPGATADVWWDVKLGPGVCP